MNYNEAMQYIESLGKFGIHLGMERITGLVERAVGEKRLGGGEADAAGSAGDEGGLAGKSHGRLLWAGVRCLTVRSGL